MKNKNFINEKRPHESAIKHVSGKAYYVDDIPEPPGTLYGAIGWSKKSHAIIKKINFDKVINSDKDIVVWGDGSAIRDFIHARDCAQGMIEVFEQGITEPINLASGKGISIREIVETIVPLVYPQPEVIWDTSKPSGDSRRVLDTSRAESYGIFPKISLNDGICETLEWYKANMENSKMRYNSFTENIKHN